MNPGRRTASPLVLLAGALLLSLAGCGSSSEDEMPAKTEPTAVKFEGKPDPAYAGKYKTVDGKSTYTFDESGSFELVGKVSSPGGTFDQNVKGSWAINGDRFLFKYGEGNVVPYSYVKDGKKLKLTLTGSMKRETVLIKE